MRRMKQLTKMLTFGVLPKYTRKDVRRFERRPVSL